MNHIGVGISLLIPQNSTPLLLDNEFLITFTGVVLGISATIVTFIFSSTDKVKSVLESTYDTPEKVSDVFSIFKKGYTELVQDMMECLLESAGIAFEDLDHCYLSGAFPAHSDLESAITIGIFPDLPREKYRRMSNSSMMTSPFL